MERRTKTSKSFYDSFLITTWKRVYVYAASLVGRKEGNSYGVEKEFSQLHA